MSTALSPASDTRPLPAMKRRQRTLDSCLRSGGCEISCMRAAEDGAYRRWPPLGAAVCCWCSGGVELARDLGEASTSGALSANPVRYYRCDCRGPADRRRLRVSSCRPPLLCEEPLQLVDRNQPRTPGHLERLDQGQYAPVEGGAADPKCLGCLCSGVGKSLNACCLADDRWRRGRPELGRRARVPLSFLVLPPHSTA
jgi:hypothetical protein